MDNSQYQSITDYSTSTLGQDGPDYISNEKYGEAAVRAQFDYLANGVAADLTRIARRAYAEKLITHRTFEIVTKQATNQSDQATDLVSAIQMKIRFSNKAFRIFLKILREEPVVSELADTLEDGLVELEKTRAQKRPSHGGGAGGQWGEGGGGTDGKKGGASTRESNFRVAGLSKTSLPSAADMVCRVHMV